MPDQNPTDPITTGPVTSFKNLDVAPPTESPAPVQPTADIAPPLPPVEVAPPSSMADSELPPAPPIVEEAPAEGTAAPTFDISSTISPEPPPKKKFGGKKMVATILGLLVLVGGLGAGIVLVQQQQDIRQRAKDVECASSSECGDGYRCVSNKCVPVVTPTPTLTPTATRPPTPPTGTPPATGTPTFPQTCSGLGAGYGCYVNLSSCVSGTSRGLGSFDCRDSQYCCKATSPTPTTSLCPKDCVAPKSKCAAGSFYPNESQALGYGDCGAALGEYCCSSASPTTTVVPTVTGTQCSRVNLVSGSTNSTSITISQAMLNECKNKCPSGVLWVSRYKCNGIGLSQGCQDNGEVLTYNASVGQTFSASDPSCGTVQVDVGCKSTGNTWGGVAYASKAAATACEPTSPPPPGATAQCLNVKAYDTEWNQITAAVLPTLKAGDKVRFAVAGTATSGNFDKAKFKINGTERAEVSVKKPGTEEFYDEYTIPEGVTTFSINAQIHHSSLGWSN